MLTSHKPGDPKTLATGAELIKKGRVGCILLAGGDGTRLGWKGPKGTFPISLVKQKSLFQLLNERVAAASQFYKQELKLAVMCSPLNFEETSSAFPARVDLFCQNLASLLDEKQKTLEERRPNGNGEVLKCFYESGLFAKWKRAGIEIVQVILVDNPLAEPFDPFQVGLHKERDAQLTLKAVEKAHPDEKVGVIGRKEGRLVVVEYSENPPSDWTLANTSLFSFSMDFIEEIKDVALPPHLVKKFIDGKPVFKRECFLFDLLPHAERAEVILMPRSETFAPLKSRDDVERVQRALLERDKRAFELLTGQPAPDRIFELDAPYHFPTNSLQDSCLEESICSFQ